MQNKNVLNLKTLVLNSTYEPLSTWPLSLIMATEAVSKLYKDRVDTVEIWPDCFFNSPSCRLEVPKTVVLKHYAHVYSEPKFSRRSIFLRDRFKCQYCGKQFPTDLLTFDHLIPRSAGGKTEWTNIITC